MTKAEKLKDKLKKGTINAKDLRTLLTQEGWTLDHSTGSHEVWHKDGGRFILAAHSKDLKIYQIKQAKTLILGEKDEI